MTYPRWATERSDQTAAGESLEPAAAPLERSRNRRLLAALRRRLVLILALVVVAVILVLIAANLIATPDLAAAVPAAEVEAVRLLRL